MGEEVSERDGFGRIARAYRWLEYLALGRTLERVRERWLGEVSSCREALVLGDGDGRFTAALLAANTEVRVTAVDGSAAMLRLLRTRCPGAHGVCADVRGYRVEVQPDLVATHFLLDCLTQVEVEALVARVAAAMAEGGLWVVSEFQIPAGVMRWPARVYVRGLYLAFRVLTGLRVTRLPEFAGAMEGAGLRRVKVQRALFGVLTAELWQKGGNEASE